MQYPKFTLSMNFVIFQLSCSKMENLTKIMEIILRMNFGIFHAKNLRNFRNNVILKLENCWNSAYDRSESSRNLNSLDSRMTISSQQTPKQPIFILTARKFEISRI